MKPLVDSWRSNLLDQVTFADQKGSMNFYLLIFNQSLARRFLSELDQAIHFHDSGSYLNSYIHARSLIETASLFLALSSLMAKSCIDIEGLDKNATYISADDLKKIAFGGREEVFKVKQTNILTLVDKFDKKHKNTRRIYDQLSEFTHPNFRGVVGYYCDLDDDGDVAVFEQEKARLEIDDYFSFLSSIINSAYNYFVEIQGRLEESTFHKVSSSI